MPAPSDTPPRCARCGRSLAPADYPLGLCFKLDGRQYCLAHNPYRAEPSPVEVILTALAGRKEVARAA